MSAETAAALTGGSIMTLAVLAPSLVRTPARGAAALSAALVLLAASVVVLVFDLALPRAPAQLAGAIFVALAWLAGGVPLGNRLRQRFAGGTAAAIALCGAVAVLSLLLLLPPLAWPLKPRAALGLAFWGCGAAIASAWLLRTASASRL